MWVVESPGWPQEQSADQRLTAPPAFPAEKNQQTDSVWLLIAWLTDKEEMMIDMAKFLLLLTVVMLLTACGPPGNDTTGQKSMDGSQSADKSQQSTASTTTLAADSAMATTVPKPMVSTEPGIIAGKQQIAALFSNSGLDLSKVSVARMQLGGRPFEVASLQPYARPKKWKTEKTSVTAFYFNKTKDALNLITVDLQADKTTTVTLGSDWLKGGGEITFPIADDTGTVKPTSLKSRALLTR